jgi:mRNA-degrading endonuclease toxin of MazEF toxin-antitoxin module
VVSCDNIVTVPKSVLGRHIGYLVPSQENALVHCHSKRVRLGLSAEGPLVSHW